MPEKQNPFERGGGRVITAQEAIDALELYPKPMQFLAGGPVDGEYFAPSPNLAIKLIADVRNPLKYRNEVYDCDDFAIWFKSEMSSRWAAEGHTRQLAVAILMGGIVLEDGRVLYHAWNAVFLDNGKMVMVEPQGPVAFAGVRVARYVIFNVIF